MIAIAKPIVRFIVGCTCLTLVAPLSARPCERGWAGDSEGVAWSSSGHNTPPEVLAAVAAPVNGGFGGIQRLVIGGAFDLVAGRSAHNVAYWDGAAWRPLGGGFDGPVTGLATDGSSIYAVGSFTAAEGNTSARFFARWDGTAWRQVGAGLFSSSVVSCVAAASGGVAIGGFNIHVNGFLSTHRYVEFLMPGGNPVFNECFDNNNNVDSCLPDAAAIAIDVNGPDRAVVTGSIAPVSAGKTVSTILQLPIVGSQFWDSRDWPSSNAMRAFRRVGSQYYGGGRVSYHPVLRKSDFGTLSDSWADLHIADQSFGEVSAIGARGTNPAAAVAFDNGSSIAYSLVYEVVNGSPEVISPIFNDRVNAIVYTGTTTYACGRFTQVGAKAAHGVAYFDGTNWLPLVPSVDNTVSAITALAGEPWIGGSFTSYGPDSVQNLARLHNGAWEQPSTPGPNGAVTALGVWAPSPVQAQTRVIVGGDFTSINGQSVSQICEFIYNPGVTISNMLGGVNGLPRAAIQIPWSGINNNRAVVAGDFTVAGGTTVNFIGTWDGTSFSRIGAPATAGTNGTVRALAYLGGSVIVGGDFTVAGGIVRIHVASCNPINNTWASMGNGLNGGVRALAVYGGSVYAGGDFTASGPTPLEHIARWTGSTWAPVGGGVNGVVHSLTVLDGDLVVGGEFTDALSPTPAHVNHFALWNGATYRAQGTGTDGPVMAMSQAGADLYVAGSFVTVDGRPSKYLARSTPQTSPYASLYVNTGPPCAGQDVMLVAQPSNCGNPHYVWRINSGALNDGPTPWGSVISGSSTGVLTISNPSNQDIGLYRCDIACDCGSISTLEYRLDLFQGPQFTQQPADLVVCRGSLMTLTVEATGTAPFHYLWMKDGLVLPVADVPSLFTLATDAEAGSYSCIIQNTCGTVVSRTAVVSVVDVPVITGQPQAASRCPGAAVNFAISASNSTGATYEWRKNGVILTDHAPGPGSGVSGATTANITISYLTAADAGDYSCTITHGCAAASFPAQLTINSPGNCCRGDFNGDGLVTVQDIFDFLVAYFAGDSHGDFNGVGGITVQDIFDYLTAYFAGC